MYRRVGGSAYKYHIVLRNSNYNMLDKNRYSQIFLIAQITNGIYSSEYKAV